MQNKYTSNRPHLLVRTYYIGTARVSVFMIEHNCSGLTQYNTVHSTTQNSSDDLPSQPPDNHDSSDVVYGKDREQTEQWRRQRSKGARSFRGQNILEPGHPDALFPQTS